MAKIESTSYIDFKNSTFNKGRIQSVHPHKEIHRFMFTVLMSSGSSKTFNYLDEAERDADCKLFNAMRAV